jgi:outer membrane biosynthesis protein TonB
MHGVSRSLLVTAALALWSLAMIQPAAGAVRTWTLTRSPAAITAGSRTAVTLVVTDTGGSGGSSPLGCLTVAIPSGFGVSSASVTAAPAGKTWAASVAGAGPATVTVRAASDKARLVGGSRRESVTFRVAVTGRSPGAFAWTGTAYADRSCSRSLGGSQRLTVTVTAAPTPRPTPKPTPRPTAKPTPRPTPAPTPKPKPSPTPPAEPAASLGPSTAPTLPPPASPVPPTSGPNASATPRPTPSPTPVAALPAGPLTPGGPPPDEFVVAGSGPARDEISIGLGDLGPLVSLEWLVPAAVLAVPGLLLVVAVAAQVVGGIVWVPVSRRVLGGRRGRAGESPPPRHGTAAR